MNYNYDRIYAYILYAVIVGVGIGVLYDLFRVFRVAVGVRMPRSPVADKPKKSVGFFANTVIFICDILFFVTAGVISAIFIFHVNNGRIRGIAIFGAAVGFTFYYRTLSRLTLILTKAAIRLIYRLVHRIYNTAVSILQLLAKPVGIIYHRGYRRKSHSDSIKIRKGS